MAVGDSIFPDMPVINGLKLSAISAGIKNKNQLDLVLIALPESAMAAGVFTHNAYCAAPVTLCRKHLAQSSNSRYLLINSGNANACTGEEGMQAAIQTCARLAEEKNIEPYQVLPFSTGVVGEPLPLEKILIALPRLLSTLDESHWHLAAQGIMTTDTRPKGATVTIEIDGHTVSVNGIAKGSGMIKPDMATMLAYVVTDATVNEAILKQLVKEATDLSFNRITIDGDTSTNDSCILVATAESPVLIHEASSPSYQLLRTALIDVFQQLAQAIVKDGEGATKFVSVSVEEGASQQECLDVAYAIAHSPLVKTALFASDPNWGRIVVAIGNAGIVDLDVRQVSVYLGDVLLVENGGRAKTYREQDGQRVMDQSDLHLRVFLGRGSASEVVWTTDLSHEYVRINAEYRS